MYMIDFFTILRWTRQGTSWLDRQSYEDWLREPGLLLSKGGDYEILKMFKIMKGIFTFF